MPTKVGTANIIFGTKDESWGYVDNLSISNEAEKHETKNGDNDTVAVTYHSHKQAISGTFTCVSETTPTGPMQESPIGKQINIKTEGSQTISAVIEKVDTNYARGEAKKCTFEATVYPALETE